MSIPQTLELLRQQIEFINYVKELIVTHLDSLRTEVAALTQVVDSATYLIDGIANRLEEFKDDPAEIQNIVDELRANRESLATAVAEHSDLLPPEGPPVTES